MIFDFTGRTLPKWFNLFSAQYLWLPVLVRAVFFVLFIFCVKPKYFESDIIPYVLMSVFALTNGYLASEYCTQQFLLISDSFTQLYQ